MLENDKHVVCNQCNMKMFSLNTTNLKKWPDCLLAVTEFLYFYPTHTAQRKTTAYELIKHSILFKMMIILPLTVNTHD